jgi:hypothetical protein
MYLLDELLQICNKGADEKEIVLLVENKDKIEKYAMVEGHYITDNVWFSEIVKSQEHIRPMTNYSFIEEMEQECVQYPNDWGDLYIAPMESLGGCELKFVDTLMNKDDIIDNDKYSITGLEEREKEIIIHILENE